MWKSFSITGNETISLSVYQGSASLVVFKKGSESRRPVVKMTLTIASCLKIADILTQLLDAQPETRQPFLQMSFNKETRAYEQNTSFVFFKDERRCYGLEISNRAIPTPIKILFKCPATFSTGSEALSDEQKSQLAVRELIIILRDQIPQAMLLSRFNMEPIQKGGPRSGGTYRRKNADSGRSNQDPYSSPSPSGGSDEIFG